jgi:AcrR family transcriptional regulator
MATAPTTSTASLRADSARVRERMLAAARERVAAGELELPMNAIAKDAGVGVGTMYRHFPSRQALLETLATDSFETLVAQAKAAPDGVEGLTELLRVAQRRLLTDPSLAAVLANPTFECAETVVLSHELSGAFMRLLDQAKKAGTIRPDVTGDDLRRLMCGLQYAARSGGDPEAAAERYLDILIKGLRP